MRMSALQDIATERNTPRPLHLRHPTKGNRLFSGPGCDPVTGDLEEGVSESDPGVVPVQVWVKSLKSESAIKYIDKRKKEDYIRVNGGRGRDVVKEAEAESLIKERDDARKFAAFLITDIKGLDGEDGEPLGPNDGLKLVSIHEDFVKQIVEFAERDSHDFSSASTDTD